MSISEAKIAANQRNALRSTGPKTVEGKERSRRNSLKHGLTGEGVVLPDEDASEVERRMDALESDMAPNNEMSRLLLRRVALLSVRMDRCVEQETANLAQRVRHAVEVFDDDRLVEVEKAFDFITAEPLTNARRLRQTPEGIDRILDNLQTLRDQLSGTHGFWDWHCTERFHNLTGRRSFDMPVTRARALGEAICGQFPFLSPDDAPNLDGTDRQRWAAARMVELIDAETEALQTLRNALNPEILQADRAEAPLRAKFDPSPQATLARKYEAAAERGFFRAIRDFRELNVAPTALAEPEASPVESVGSSGNLEPATSEPEPDHVETLPEPEQPEPTKSAPLAQAAPVTPQSPVLLGQVHSAKGQRPIPRGY